MDKQFDEFSQSVAEGVSRREARRRLGKASSATNLPRSAGFLKQYQPC